jgi:hypothetical protein
LPWSTILRHGVSCECLKFVNWKNGCDRNASGPLHKSLGKWPRFLFDIKISGLTPRLIMHNRSFRGFRVFGGPL